MILRLRKWILVSLIISMLAGCGGPWSSGDRVLVSKCDYDTFIRSPHRYDVVVFKYPLEPMDRNTPKNYIKRLLGLPGELIVIFFGKLYRWSPGEGDPPPFDDVKDAKVHPNELHHSIYLHTNEEPVKHWFEEGKDQATGAPRKFEILRKPPHAMLALRRIVYDNDFQAKDLKGKLDRWNPDPTTGWKSDDATGFIHEGKADGHVDWIRYQHLLRPDGNVVHGGMQNKVKPRLITDSMDYNSFRKQSREGGFVSDETPSHPHWVGDLMLECNLEVIEPKGEFWFELSKGIHRYQARFDLSSGNCTLFRLDRDGKSEEGGEFPARADTRVKAKGSYMLRLANIDSRLTVWVDRDLPFGDGKDYASPDIRGPKDSDLSWEEIGKRRGPTLNDLEPASIGSKGAHVKINHIRLWRDTYYTTVVKALNNFADYEGRIENEAWSNPKSWEPLRKQRFATLFVQPGHYLCMGDNSQRSADSREWGLVPERLMLGRALMVYFPLDRMGPIR